MLIQDGIKLRSFSVPDGRPSTMSSVDSKHVAADLDAGRAHEVIVVSYEWMDETQIGLLDGALNLL